MSVVVAKGCQCSAVLGLVTGDQGGESGRSDLAVSVGGGALNVALAVKDRPATGQGVGSGSGALSGGGRREGGHE